MAGLPPPEKPKAKKKGPVPFWLELYLECKEWNIPLVAGGLLDQPDWAWHLMNLAGRVYLSEKANG